MNIKKFPIHSISENDEFLLMLKQNFNKLKQKFPLNNRTALQQNMNMKVGLTVEALFAKHFNLDAPLYEINKYGDGGYDHIDNNKLKYDTKLFDNTKSTITFPKTLKISLHDDTPYVAHAFPIYTNFTRDNINKIINARFFGIILSKEIPEDLLHWSKFLDRYKQPINCYMFLDDLTKLPRYISIEETYQQLTLRYQ